MPAARFDHLIRTLTESRRSLIGVGLWLAVSLKIVAESDARRRKRRKRRKKQRPVFNQFGCVNVGGRCYGKSANCCSGICEGTGKDSRCVAHNAFDCTVFDDACLEPVSCGADGRCYRTTGNAGFCGDSGLCDCGPCVRDTDCEAEFGPGAACIVCTSPGDANCIGVNGSQGTACVPPASAA